MPITKGDRAEFVSIIKETFKTLSTDHSFIDRIGKNKNEDTEKHRAVLVKFTSHLDKQKILARKKLLKTTNIRIMEDITAARFQLFKSCKNNFGVRNVWTNNGTAARFQLFKSCKNNFGVRNVWTNNGKIFVKIGKISIIQIL
ncbi:hypothetical protein QE152_g4420 [Popillia japonica]|uniref:Uncharacterized protein n=1 Tax=Popillia japonica TaxID=7064 RepID=A0AAW1N0Y0_POPJA